MAKSKKLKLQTYQIGSPRKASDGLRIATTRYLPRGVRKKDWPEYFDVWLPTLAPSRELLAWARSGTNTRSAEYYFVRYRRELLDNPDSRHALKFVAEVSRRMRVSVGCYCDDESQCHRSMLFKMIEEAAKWP